MESDSSVELYNGLAESYHLVYADWQASVQRQGEQLAAIIRERWQARRLLDAACGIGTQAIGLASQGFDVVASDLASEAVDRARREAAARGCLVQFLRADLRRLTAVHSPPFDVVVACDNAIPHLLSDAEILTSFREMHSLLRPGGGCLISVRDYGAVERSGTQMHSYGVRDTSAGRVAVFQVWDFCDPAHYDLSMFFVHDIDRTPRTQVFRGRYYAILLGDLEELMRQAGFVAVDCLRDRYFQPVLVGTKPHLP